MVENNIIDFNKFGYSDFEELCKEIVYFLNWYENSRNFAMDMENTIFLSNGEKIKYSIPKSSVAHLLGINTENIKVLKIVNSNSSYEILQYMCNNILTVHNALKRNNGSYRSIISPYIDIKLDAFKSHFDSAKMRIKDIEFICKYNPKLCYIDGMDKKNIDYVIGTRNGEMLTLLGLKKQENGNSYIPVTSQMVDLKTEEGKNTLNSFIKNQILTLPETIKSRKGYWEENGFFFDEVLLQKLENLDNYVRKYNCIIDVSHYLQYNMSKEINSRKVATAVCESMISGKPVEDIEFKGKVPKYLQDLLLYTKGLQPISREEEIKKLKELKNITLELEQYKQKVTDLQNEISRLSDMISSLNQEKSSLNDQQQYDEQTFEKIKKLILEREEKKVLL